MRQKLKRNEQNRPTVFHRLALPLLAATVALGWSLACTPDIAQDPWPEIMEFDTTTGRAPQPTILVINQETGYIDFSVIGIDVPADCTLVDPNEMAQCEFYTYMESLDGWPTVTPITAPASAVLDLNTVTMPENLLIVGGTGMLSSNDVVISFDEEEMELVVAPLEGWDIGVNPYAVAIRGYDAGVKTADGGRVVASSTYYLLKSEESLTCGAATPAEIGPDCPYYQLVSEQVGAEAAPAALMQLEALRQGFLAAGLWDTVDLFGMPKEEIAIVWAFPTHSNPVVENYPPLGMIPTVVSDTELRLTAKGTLDASTLTAYSLMNMDGEVLLLNLTKLDEGDYGLGIPPFAVTFEEPEIVMSTVNPMIDGDLYGVILRTSITDEDGLPLVPSPLTVMLKSRGALVNTDGVSLISGVDDADAADAEEGRQLLAALLDNQDFANLTGMTREDIAYVYAFRYPDPTSTD